MSDMHTGAKAITKAEHDELVEERHRNATDYPIGFKRKERRAAPENDDSYRGFRIVDISKGEQ